MEKSSAAVRQIGHRAREHVAARRPRMDVNRTEQQEVVDRFVAAVSTGDIEGLLEVLAPDVIVVGDGGGLAPAVRKPVEGAKVVAKLLSNYARVAPDAPIETLMVNGAIGAWVDPNGEFETAVSVTVHAGRITRIYAMRNPEKLDRLEEVANLSR